MTIQDYPNSNLDQTEHLLASERNAKRLRDSLEQLKYGGQRILWALPFESSVLVVAPSPVSLLPEG